MAIFFALIPFFTWAFSDLCGALAARKIGNLSASLGFLLVSFLFLSLGLPFAGDLPDWPFFGLALLLGGIHVVGLVAYFRGVEIGNASLVGSIAGSFSILIVIFSFIFFHDALNSFQLGGIFLCLAGLLLASFQFGELKNIWHSKQFISDPGVILAFITFLAWGIYFTFIRIPVEQIGWYWSLYPATFYVFPLLLVPKIRKKLTTVRFDKKTLGLVLLMAVLGRIGDLTYNIALTHGLSSLVGAIAGTSPVLFVVLARFVFRDKLTMQQRIGIISTVSGIILITLASS